MANENILRANERLREERMRRGWSQQKLADELGIAVVTVNRWERGKQQPTGYYRLKLTTLFEKSAEELGLVESQTEVVLPVYAGEPQKNENEVVSAFRSERNDQVKDTIPLFYETVTEQSSLEREVAARPLSPRNYTYNLSSTSLLNKRRRTMLLLLVLIVLVVAAPITFLLIHFSKISVFPTSRSIRSSVVRITPSSLNKPFAPPITWKEVDDPLTKAHHDTQWTDDGSQCIFHADGYYSVSQGTNYCNYGDSSVNNISDLAYW